MNLRYMMSDKDLAGVKVVQPKKRTSPNKNTIQLQNQIVQSERPKKTIRQRMRGLCSLVPSAIAIFGLAVLVHQSILWFKYGYWKPLSASLVLSKALPSGWLHSGSSWPGVSNVMPLVFNSPLGPFLLVFSLLLHVFMVTAFDFIFKPRRTRGIMRGWRS
jgi:hypothetical protein